MEADPADRSAGGHGFPEFGGRRYAKQSQRTWGSSPDPGSGAHRPLIESTARGGRGATLGVLAAAAGVLGLMEAAQVWAGFAFQGRPVTLRDALAGTLPSWAILVVLVLPLGAVLRRFPLEASTVRRDAAVHALVAVGFTVSHLGASAVVAEWSFGGPGIGERFLRLGTVYFVPDLLTYTAVISVMRWTRRMRHEVAVARRGVARAEGHLSAVRDRLRPDFVLNTLNAVAGLAVRGEAEKGLEVAADLGVLVRTVLEQESVEGSLLGEEVALAEGYLRIQDARYPGRVTWTTTLPPGRAGVRVAPLAVLSAVGELVEPALGTGRVHLTLDARTGGETALEVRSVDARDDERGRRVAAWTAPSATETREDAWIG